jgi:HIRAN domain
MLIVAALFLLLIWIVIRQWRRNQLGGRSVFTTQVQGIYHDNADGLSRQEIISRCHVREEVFRVPEPDNPKDPEAVKVCRKNGEQIGYWRGYSDLAYRIRIG